MADHLLRCFSPSTSSNVQLSPLERAETAQLFVVGIIQGIEIGCNNKSLEFLPVSVRTMINSTSVLFMMVTARCWSLERLGCLRLCAAALVITGGILEGSGELKTVSDDGRAAVLLQVASMAVGAQRWALLQAVMQHSPRGSALGQMSKLQIMTRILPITGVVCLCLAVPFEATEDSTTHASRGPLGLSAFMHVGPGMLLLSVVGISCGVVTLTVAELQLVHLTSAVALQVLGTLHQIPIMLAGVVLFQEEVGLPTIAGFGLCVCGAMCYTAARQEDKRFAAQQLAAEEWAGTDDSRPLLSIGAATAAEAEAPEAQRQTKQLPMQLELAEVED
eukprot:gnl/TRDRNA2_/TRDRNA2_176363_c0_seq2.p1 gnl/TRDRNA2_/TRDRNA2_176363_c0~~gnl/TRDRNA2_/TRDRNA2_176363_c0_seq2.p1  ORF type:complete len:366 (+),score=71.50 gnl/TRDRNA2_/TRDRNA2_176363_c0_seq2:102-1100(+)